MQIIGPSHGDPCIIRFFYGNWSDSYSEDLYDSENYDTEEEDRFEAQSTPSTSNSSLDSWLKGDRIPNSHEEVEGNHDKEEEIPDLVSDDNGNLTPAAQAECSLLSVTQEHSDNGGGELSVFTNLGKSVRGPSSRGLDSQLVTQRFQLPNSPVW